jgi:hypothetical protein
MGLENTVEIACAGSMRSSRSQVFWVLRSTDYAIDKLHPKADSRMQYIYIYAMQKGGMCVWV